MHFSPIGRLLSRLLKALGCIKAHDGCLLEECKEKREEDYFGLLTLWTGTSSTRSLTRYALTLRSFAAAFLGTPKVLKEGNIHTEFPLSMKDEDEDGGEDENVPLEGLEQPLSGSGEASELSGALALFRLSRILSRILDEVFLRPSRLEMLQEKLGKLNDELNAWLVNLPSHLRLAFSQDKPSTSPIEGRAPILVSEMIHFRNRLIDLFSLLHTITFEHSFTDIRRSAGEAKILLLLSHWLSRAKTLFKSCNYLKNAG